MKRSTLHRSVLAFAGALLVSASLAGTAGAAPLVDPSPTAHAAAVTAAEQADVANFWTSERMRSAVPVEDLLRPGQLAKITRSTGAQVERGVPQTVQPTSGTVFGPTANPHGGGPWTGGGAIVKTEGRVFFTYTGRTASCSGTAVTSANKSTVITAGHCVKLDGAFHTNWVFVPAYDNNNRPYGTWTAKKTYATQQWVASEDINHDVGAAVVNPLNGQNLTDVVGGQGIAFNQARGQNMYAFGYPAAAPYDGSKLIYCSGSTFNAFLSDGIGMTCDMTGGSSGGGWFLRFSESTGAGIVNSVNSYKINFIPTWMFGPYFGASAQSLYNTAQPA